MHPILFRIPLPSYPVPYAWLVLGLAALSILLGLYFGLIQRDRRSGVVAGLVGAVLVGVRFELPYVLGSVLHTEGDTWQMGPIPIYSYGVMLGLSLVVGWYLTLGLAERDGLPKETMANNYVFTAVTAVIGSRILYVLTNLNEFDSIGSIFAMRRGGLVAYGGFLGGLLGSIVFLKYTADWPDGATFPRVRLRRHPYALLPWADVAVPSLASGLMITRIGCYLFGCDFGQPLKETAPEWLKKLGSFPHWAEGTLEHGSGSPAWVQHVKERGLSQSAASSLPVHPTQLYESLTGLCLLGLLLWARRHQKFRGQIFFLFAFAYGVARYLLEILRDDAERGSLPPALPEHVLIPLGLVILAVGWCIGFSRAIRSVPLQRVTQVASFVPAILVYMALKPESFASSPNVEWSTSQFIAISSGFAASVAFAVFYKAALAHPKQAMDLGLPPEPLPEGAEPPPPPADDDDEEVRKPVRRVKKKVKRKAKPVTTETATPEEETAPVETKAPAAEDEPEQAS